MNTDLSVYASENLCYRPTSIFFLKHYIAFQIAQEQKQFRNLCVCYLIYIPQHWTQVSWWSLEGNIKLKENKIQLGWRACGKTEWRTLVEACIWRFTFKSNIHFWCDSSAMFSALGSVVFHTKLQLQLTTEWACYPFLCHVFPPPNSHCEKIKTAHQLGKWLPYPLHYH